MTHPYFRKCAVFDQIKYVECHGMGQFAVVGESEAVFVGMEDVADYGQLLPRIRMRKMFQNWGVAHYGVHPACRQGVNGLAYPRIGTSLDPEFGHVVLRNTALEYGNAPAWQVGQGTDALCQGYRRHDACHRRGYVGNDTNPDQKPEGLPYAPHPAEQILARCLAGSRNGHDMIEALGYAFRPALWKSRIEFPVEDGETDRREEYDDEEPGIGTQMAGVLEAIDDTPETA